MFSKLAIIVSFAILAVASPCEPTNQCNTGPVQCCNSVQPAGSPAAISQLALVGAVVQNANVPIGMDCSPITVGGVGSGGQCSSNPVCCQNNTFNGIVAIGCVSVIVNL